MLFALLVFPAEWMGLLAGVVLAASTGDLWIVAKLRRFPVWEGENPESENFRVRASYAIVHNHH